VRKASLAKILCDNLDDIDELQPNVFRPPTNNSRNGRMPCSDIPGLNLTAWKEQVDEDFPGFHYSGWGFNFSHLAKGGSSAGDEANAEEEELDFNSMSESELYFLEDESEFQLYEQETPGQLSYTDELPVPFISVPGEEENEKTFIKENEKSTAADDRVRRPIGREPGVADLTDHNYNNVVEHAYANTLFYRRHSP
ncbi:hem peroxidase, partial [Trinorchestia longiramus]